MKITFNKMDPTIKKVEDSRSLDLLAYVSLKLTEEHERHLTINGFTIRKSQHNGKPYLVPPSRSLGYGKGFFKYTLIEESLWKEIEREILKEYNYSTIPIIND